MMKILKLGEESTKSGMSNVTLDYLQKIDDLSKKTNKKS